MIWGGGALRRLRKPRRCLATATMYLPRENFPGYSWNCYVWSTHYGRRENSETSRPRACTRKYLLQFSHGSRNGQTRWKIKGQKLNNSMNIGTHVEWEGTRSSQLFAGVRAWTCRPKHEHIKSAPPARPPPPAFFGAACASWNPERVRLEILCKRLLRMQALVVLARDSNPGGTSGAGRAWDRPLHFI